MANNVLSVANEFIRLAKSERIPLSNMKLQKLLYLAQGHSFGLANKALVSELPEAWRYGPVYPSVYHAFKEYGAGDIKSLATVLDFDEGDLVPYERVKSADDLELIKAVWDAYKDTSPVELSNMSHVQGGPWDKVYGTYKNADLREEDMREFFSARD